MRSSASEIQRAFAEVLGLSTPGERHQLLDRLEGEHPSLGREVRLLFEAHEAAHAFEKPIPQTDKATVIMEPAAEAPCTTIDHYKLREQLGEGGMGIVYVAEQTGPISRKVALKIIKPGMDSKQVLARFETERQTLAMMSHPNVAAVLDGGTTAEGRPYFVMELVRGVAIDDYCERENLTVDERLSLFVKVCQGVHHAHLKGIIHRDLKPGNILVEQHDTEAIPKVIDFGIAKVLHQPLTGHTVYTQYTQLIGTPEYMSPEQARLSGNDIDIRSDIYSLGVVLYELVTGVHPYSSDTKLGFDKIQELLRKCAPTRPSQLLASTIKETSSRSSRRKQADENPSSRPLSCELDWIVMKALDKDRDQRYQSAAAFAQDLQRYLRGEPVDAGPPSFAYRLKRIAYRHRGMLAAGALIVLIALLGTSVSLWYATQANRAAQKANAARDLAETHAERANRANARLKEILYATDIKLASQFWKEGDVRNLAKVLEPYETDGVDEVDLRGFEWWYLHTLGVGNARVLSSRSEQACLVRHSPDGRFLFLGWSDGRMDVCDGASHAVLFSLHSSADFVNGCDFHEETMRLATVGDDGHMHLWDLKTRELIRRIRVCDGHAHRVFFNSDGTTILSSGEGDCVYYWDTATGEEVSEIGGFSGKPHSGIERRLTCSPLRDRIAIGDGDGGAALYDFESRVKIASLERIDRENSLRIICYSPDGRLLAGATKTRKVHLWNAENGVLLKTFEGHWDDIMGLAFHPSSGILVSGDRGGVIRTWNLLSEVQESLTDRASSRAFVAHDDRLLSLEFSPDGTSLITGGRDGKYRVWDRLEQSSVEFVEVLSPLVVDFVQGGNRLVVVGKQSLSHWDGESPHLTTIASPKIPIIRAAIDPRGECLITAHTDGSLQVWNPLTGALVTVLETPFTDFASLHISAERGVVLTCSYRDERVSLWDFNPTLISMPRETMYGYDDAWLHPDGRHAILHSLDVLYLFDLDTLEKTHKFSGHLNRVSEVALTSDGSRMASASEDRSVKIWNPRTGHLLHTILAHESKIHQIAFSPDGRTLVSADAAGMILFSSTTTGRGMLQVNLQDEEILDLKFAPDGRRLAVVQPQRLVMLGHSGGAIPGTAKTSAP